MRKKLFLNSTVAWILLIIVTTGVMMNASWLNHVDQIFIQYRLPDNTYVTVFVGMLAKVATIVPMVLIFGAIAIFLLKTNRKSLAIW